MKLAPGNPVVPFSTVDVEGHPVSLEQFRGHPLLLMFFRYASCPMCNLRRHDFAEEYPRLQARGLSALSRSFTRLLGRSRGMRVGAAIRFPSLRIRIRSSTAFGTETSWPGLLKSIVLPSFYRDWIRSMRHGFWGGADLEMAKMPADFLVGADGRLLLVHYGRDIGDHLSVAEIERAPAEVSMTAPTYLRPA